MANAELLECDVDLSGGFCGDRKLDQGRQARDILRSGTHAGWIARELLLARQMGFSREFGGDPLTGTHLVNLCPQISPISQSMGYL